MKCFLIEYNERAVQAKEIATNDNTIDADVAAAAAESDAIIEVVDEIYDCLEAYAIANPGKAEYDGTSSTKKPKKNK